MQKRLGADNMELFTSLFPTEEAQMLKRDVSRLSEKGLRSEIFIDQQAEWAANFSAVTRIVGRKTSMEILGKVAESTYPKMFSAMFSLAEELRECEDPFGASGHVPGHDGGERKSRITGWRGHTESCRHLSGELHLVRLARNIGSVWHPGSLCAGVQYRRRLVSPLLWRGGHRIQADNNPGPRRRLLRLSI